MYTVNKLRKALKGCIYVLYVFKGPAMMCIAVHAHMIEQHYLLAEITDT